MALAPSAVLIAGTYVLKPELIAYAIALAGMLAGYLVFSNCMCIFHLSEWS
jgi:cytochrome-b5 reductase